MTIKQIPDDVLQGFKAYAALQGKTMNEIMIELMREKAGLVKLQKESKN